MLRASNFDEVHAYLSGPGQSPGGPIHLSEHLGVDQCAQARLGVWVL
jgi:hypothetical protein